MGISRLRVDAFCRFLLYTHSSRKVSPSGIPALFSGKFPFWKAPERRRNKSEEHKDQYKYHGEKNPGTVATEGIVSEGAGIPNQDE